MTDRDLAVRSARPDDVDRIALYHHETWSQAYAPLLAADVMALARPQVDLWRDRLAAGSGYSTMVTVDGDDLAIGHVTVHQHVLVHLCISPGEQGNGLGRSLLTVGEDMLRRDGHRHVELHTRVGNTRAIGLYTSCDWEMTEETVHDPLPDGSTYPEHVMRKDLGDPHT